MKNYFRFLMTAVSIIITSSLSAQWTTSGTNVGLTTTTNNVIIGPTPATPTNLHINSSAVVGSNSNTVVTIENTGSATSKSANLTFKNGGFSYSISTATFPGIGSGMFQIGNLIHMNGSQITFSTGYSHAYSGIFTSKYNFRGGLSAFDSITTPRLGVNTMPPTGYTFAVSGQSNFAGKVAIGISNLALPASSTHKLFVGGSIICEEVVVKLQANWPDFVFSPQYKLMPLTQVKKYIETNNHLPGVPAACEVAENGVATGEMLNIQMQKIEELTLYLIQMEERIKQLEAQNKALSGK